jgi:VIT1/CCC1 family predicted Fe2+/Mn2+ transporter
MQNKISHRASRYRPVTQPDNDNLSKFVFGSFDGMTCVLGVVAGCYVSGNIHALILSVVGLAIAEGIAMAGGSYLSELVGIYRVRHALIIGIASAVGILVPAFPFFFAPAHVAILLSLFLTCVLAVIIAQVRVRTLGALEAYVQTFVLILMAAGVSVVVTLLLNKVGV